MLLLFLLLTSATPHAPTNLRVNNMPTGPANEAGALVLSPHAALRFSWQLGHSERGVTSSAYQLSLRGNGARVWDSGVQRSTEMQAVLRNGLREDTEYCFSVRWADHHQEWSADSQPGCFRTGLTGLWNNTDWVGGADAKMLRKEWTSVGGSPMLHIVGLGYFQVFVNGQRVGSEALSGAWTTYHKSVLYYSYDISQYVKAGKNAIGVMLGAGWRDTTAFNPKDGTVPCEADTRLLRAAVVTNGKVEVGSEASWEVSAAGPVVADSVYNGETYDASKVQTGWSEAGFAGNWKAVGALGCTFDPQLQPASMPAVTVQEERKPVNITKLATPCQGPGGVVDENDVMTLKCASGTITGIKFASFGDPEGSCGSFKVGKCNAANSTDVVSKMCVGKSTCQITAADSVFGDPCLGEKKKLAVDTTGCQAEATYVVDFGENLAGWMRLKAEGPAGTTITMKHAEVLQHPPYGPVDGSVYQGNLRSAKATDIFVLNGTAGGEVFEPHFTYHGFQYVQISGYPGELTGEEVTQIHFRSDNTVKSKFHSSSQVLNDIQYAAVKGQGSNMMTVPTDCDQRDERLGWTGDADLSSNSFALNYDSAAFIDNYLERVADEQGDNGDFPDTVPFVRYGGRPADPSWSAVFIQNIYVRWKIGGDSAPAHKYWSQMMKYLDSVAAAVEKAGGLTKWSGPYGDWVPAGPEKKVANEVPNALNYIVNVRQGKELAVALKIADKAKELEALEAQLIDEFNAAFYDKEKKCYADCIQGAYAMAFAAGAVPAAEKDAVMQNLLANINKYNNHVTGGIISVKALFPALSDNGQKDAAVALAQQTSQPSWGYMLYNDVEPAKSSLWELWNSPTEGPGMNSRNHHMFSSISAWLVEVVGGIKGSNCMEDVAFTAAPATAVSRSSTSITTDCGEYALTYQRTGGLQCALAPEGRSSVRPGAPVTEDAVLDCGAGGGTIEAIEFASWGLPLGDCGAAAGPLPNATCHHPDSQSVVEELCLGRRSCSVPSHKDFWGKWSCDSGAPHRLVLAARCSGSHGVVAHASVPVGVKGTLSLPLGGLPRSVVQVYEGASRLSLDHGTWTEDRVEYSVGGGEYKFRLQSSN